MNFADDKRKIPNFFESLRSPIYLIIDLNFPWKIFFYKK